MQKFMLVMLLWLFAFTGEAQEDAQPVPITPENIHSLALLGHVGRGYLRDIGWSADGQWLFVETTLGIEKYDYEELSAPPEYVNVPDGFDLLATHPIENWLIDYSTNSVRFWDFETEQFVYSLWLNRDVDMDITQDIPQKLVVDPTGSYLGVIYKRVNQTFFQVRFWNIVDPGNPRYISTVVTASANNITFVSDYALIVGYGSYLVNLAENEEPRILTSLGGPNFALSPDAQQLLIPNINTISIYAVNEILTLSDGHYPEPFTLEALASDIAFSADGHYFITTMETGDGFTIYDPQTLAQLWQFTGFYPVWNARYMTTHFSPHPQDNFIVFRDANTLYSYRFDENPPQILMSDYNITPIQVNMDRTQMLTKESSFWYSVWDTRSFERLFSIPFVLTALDFIGFNQNGDVLATSIYDGELSLWDIESQQVRATREFEPPLTSYEALISADGRWFAVGNLLFDATTLAVNQPFMQALTEQGITEGRITGFDPQSRAVLYLTNDTLYILNLADGAILETFADGDATYRLLCEDIIESMQYSAIQLTESAEFLAPYQWLVRVFRANPYDWSCTGRERDFSPFEAMRPIPTANSETMYFLFHDGELWGIPNGQ